MSGARYMRGAPIFLRAAASLRHAQAIGIYSVSFGFIIILGASFGMARDSSRLPRFHSRFITIAALEARLRDNDAPISFSFTATGMLAKQCSRQPRHRRGHITDVREAIDDAASPCRLSPSYFHARYSRRCI